MAKRKRRLAGSTARIKRPTTIVIGPHHLPSTWRPFDWLVPFVDGHACIHHGHDRPDDDHSACGPTIFCCSKAARRYATLFPDSWEAQAKWEFTDVRLLQDWLEKGVRVMYFIFCDPLRSEGLLAIGLSEDPLHAVLYKQVSLEAYSERADRLG